VSSFLIFLEKPPPKKYKSTVRVKANYRPSYRNLDSSESRVFIINFTDTIESFFRNERLPGFRSIQVTRLSNGSVVVDFVTLVERNSNTTKNTIVNALIDGNSTGTLGVVLTGNINIEEIIELSTNIPTTRAVKKGNKNAHNFIQWNFVCHAERPVVPQMLLDR